MTNSKESLIEKLRAIKPSPESPELSEHAYAQAVEDCIAIIMGDASKEGAGLGLPGNAALQPSPASPSDNSSLIALRELTAAIKMNGHGSVKSSAAKTEAVRAALAKADKILTMGDASARKDEDGKQASILGLQANPTSLAIHDSDCAMHNMPAMPNGPCDCSVSRCEISVVDAEVERILAMTDEEVISEAGGVENVMIVANHVRRVFDKARLQVDIAKAIHYPQCWDTMAYPTLFDALNELAGCVGCSECGYSGKNPDADQKPTEPVSVDLKLASKRIIARGQAEWIRYIYGNEAVDYARICAEAWGLSYVD